MIAVKEIVTWLDANRSDDRRSGLRNLVVHAFDLGRAIDFYTRVFGFHGSLRREVGDEAIMASAFGEARLLLRECRTGSAALSLPQWGFVVATNLDDVRARVWELGVRIALDSGAPDQVYRRRDGGSLYIYDSESNRIELVEAPSIVAANGRSDFFGRDPGLSAAMARGYGLR